MKRTTKRNTPAFRPTSKVRVVPKGRRTQMAPDAREPHNIKVRTNIHLDLDVINFFKTRAKTAGALPYQTQINAELRKIMEREKSDPSMDINRLLQDEELITALAERIRALV